jgi:hypothetical protein
LSKKPTSTAHAVLGLVRNLSRDSGERSALSIEGLLEPPAFEQELVKERARVDRGGPPFTLLAIDLELDRASEEYAQAIWVLAAVLNERTRILDTKGWFQGRIGVILPGASSTEIPKICAQFDTSFKRRSRPRGLSGKAELPVLKYEVFVYPSDGKHSVLHTAKAGEKRV